MSETFVLITGASHGGWAWRPVAEHLRAEGHRVFTPTLPGLADGDDPAEHTLADVVDFIVDFVDGHDLHDVTMVAHSWGGYPMTGAAHRLVPRLKKLIYWSAFVPAEGRCLLDEVPPPYVEMFKASAAASGNNSVMFPYEVFVGGFMQDATHEVQQLTHQLLVPQPMQYFTETVTPIDPATFGVPISYVLSDDDLSLPPGEFGWAPRFPDRLGVTATSTPGSHEACLTRPAELAASFLAA
jgi:pimeloyl-ACP methyl ester carboxylesterase